MTLGYYIAGCVIAGLCGLASGVILACAWRANAKCRMQNAEDWEDPL